MFAKHLFIFVLFCLISVTICQQAEQFTVPTEYNYTYTYGSDNVGTSEYNPSPMTSATNPHQLQHSAQQQLTSPPIPFSPQEEQQLLQGIAAPHGKHVKMARPVYRQLPGIMRETKNIRLPTLVRAVQLPHVKPQVTRQKAPPIVRQVKQHEQPMITRPMVTAKRAPRLEQQQKKHHQQQQHNPSQLTESKEETKKLENPKQEMKMTEKPKEELKGAKKEEMKSEMKTEMPKPSL